MRHVIENILLTGVGLGMAAYLAFNVKYRLVPYLQGRPVEDDD
jgi:hypothetical protein